MRRTKTLVWGAAVLAAAQAVAVPDAARRDACERQARALVEKMTPEQVVRQLMNEAPEIRDLGIRRYHYWNEALHGVARAGLATMFPQAIGAAATFDADLEFRMADVISTEARAKYNLFKKKGFVSNYTGLTLWSPNVNMFRYALWGRGQETFGEDPYLSSVMGGAFVRGLQGDDPKFLKTAACAKHFAVHSGPERGRENFNAKVERRDLYEYYLPAFKSLVMDAKVESVMGAYSAINGVPCCANRMLLVDILRGEWGFRGHVVSDVGAVGNIANKHHYAPNETDGSLACLTNGLDLCSEGTYGCLARLARDGKLPKALFVEPAVRMLTSRLLLGDIGTEPTPWDGLGAEVVATPEHKALALRVAEESIVLVKNNGVLPLDRAKTRGVGVRGRDKEPVVLEGNYNGTSSELCMGANGLAEVAGAGVMIGDDRADVYVHFIGISPRDEGEGFDRRDAKVNKGNLESLRKFRQERPERKIVSVVFCGSPLELKEVCELSDAVLIAWYPGEQGGRAIARALFGDFNPAGRLPLTFMEDYSTEAPVDDYSLPGRTYRYATKKPFLPFGYGLSYTSFAYANVKVEKVGGGGGVKVRAEVKNAGKVAGDEVVQLYVRSPKGSGDRRLHHLEGFRRVSLKPGETKSVSFTLKPEQLMQFGMDGRQSLAKGVYTFFVGGGQPGFDKDVVEASIKL